MDSITEGAHAYTRKFYHAHGLRQLGLTLEDERIGRSRDRRWKFGEKKEAHGTLTVPIIELADQGQRIVGAIEAREESIYERRGMRELDNPAWRPGDEDKRPRYVELTLNDAGQRSAVARDAWEWLIGKMAFATGETQKGETGSAPKEAALGDNTIPHRFTFAGTVDELLEVVRDWRAWLPGKPVDATAGLSSSYVIHEPGWKMSKGTNPDIYTTKRLSESERVNLGAVTPHEDGAAVRQVTVKISLLKYGVSLTNPIHYSLGEEPNLENRWVYLPNYFGNLTVYFRRQTEVLVGRLEFPNVVKEECEQLLEDIATWLPINADTTSADKVTPASSAAGSDERVNTDASSESIPIRRDVSDRVRHAHKLLKGGSTASAVFRDLAHVEKSTYQKYCRVVTGEEPLV
jgi:hypothetical protein